MKQLLCAFLLFAGLLAAQAPNCSQSLTLTSATTGAVINTTSGAAQGCRGWALTWAVTGSITALTIQIDGSQDNSSWAAIDSSLVTTGSNPTNWTSATDSNSIVAVVYLPYIRVNITSLTGSGSVKTYLAGYSGTSAQKENPTNGPTGCVSSSFFFSCGILGPFYASQSQQSTLPHKNYPISANTTSFFDQVAQFGSDATAFGHPSFDGRDVYFPQYGGSLVLRHDGSKSFSQGWSSFDVSTLNPQAVGLQISTFDGRYLYVSTINYGHTDPYDGLMIRYDTWARNIANASAWQVFDLTAVSPLLQDLYNALGFGLVYDGSRYVYLSAEYEYSSGDYFLLRYDTTQSFTSAGSYTFVDFDSSFTANGMYGSGQGYLAYDGLKLYFVGGSSLCAYDSSGDVSSTGSYECHDLTTVMPSLDFLTMPVADGKYLYANVNFGGSTERLLRYDLSASLTSDGSYTAVDYSGVFTWSGFPGSTAVDGKFLYVFEGQSLSGKMLRIDRADVTNTANYTGFNLATINPNALGYEFGAVSDGAYMYLSPYADGNPAVVSRIPIYPPGIPIP